MKTKRINFRLLWVTFFLIAAALASRAENVCIESGPYYGPWMCVVSGSNTSSGSLSFTNLAVCSGDTIVPPTLSVPPGFTNGKMRRWVTNSCPEHPGYWETNTLRYVTGNVYFSPSIPNQITNAGSSNYTAYVDTIPTTLLAWWPGNDNTNELVYSNNCVLLNGAGYAAGEVGDGFNLDGVNDYISVADSSYLNIGISNDFSVECWIKATSGAGTSLTILDKRGTIGGRLQGYYFWLSSGKPAFEFDSSTGSATAVATTSADLRDSTFHHVAVTVDRDSTTGGKIYVDGVLKLTFNPTGAKGDLSNPGSLRMGNVYTNGLYFKGVIDELSLYQCALSSNDVQAVFNAGTSGKQWGTTTTSSQNSCSSLVNALGTLTIKVWGYTDSDYDGVCDCGEIQDGTSPTNSASVLPIRLGYWRFDNTNTWAGEAGQAPLAYTGLRGIESWSTNAVEVAATNALLRYRDIETNGCRANISLKTGTIRFWFKPNWGSATIDDNTGPQSEAPLIEVGSRGSTNGWWILNINSSGTNLCFETQTNLTSTLATNLVVGISWSSNHWHQIVLTHCSTNSLLYVDGESVSAGAGVTNYPGLNGRTLGFTVGSSGSGTNQIKGQFEELETFNYQLTASEISTNFATINGRDSDGDGIPDILESERGTNPYSYNSWNSLSSSNGLQVYTPLK